MFAVSFVVYIEPAPADGVFAVVVLFFIFMRIEAAVCVMPLLLMLVVYNLGGLLSYAQAPPEPKALMFVVTSAYMALSAVVFALYVAANPMKHVEIYRNCVVAWRCVRFDLGLIDYFNLPSPFPLQVLPGRATGLFKDPNVFSTYLIFPMIFMLQKLVLGNTRRPVLVSLALGITMIGLFLSFSRGAWANFVMAAMCLFALTFMLYDSGRVRMRLIIYVVAGLIFATVAFMILMSIPDIREMFVARFSLVQIYDAGETGRFGNQVAIHPGIAEDYPLAMDRFVFGLLLWSSAAQCICQCLLRLWLAGGDYLFPADYFNAVHWLENDFHQNAMARLCHCGFLPLFVSVIFQGIQIDTDHWRHFYWMLGIMWGLFAISMQPRSYPQKGYDTSNSDEQGARWSERQDSNLRPLTPQISALPGCATLRLGGGV